ncbi:hypothetical protein ACUXST_000670 [Sphingomonas sp. F9_3S_D5_B_2]
MPEQLPQSRNRRGCFTILAILVAFLGLYMLVSFNAQPGNDVAQNIQTVPAP